jgi:IS30 family transposase
LVTLVERSSRYTSIIKVNSKEAEVVADAIIKRANELDMPLQSGQWGG